MKERYEFQRKAVEYIGENLKERKILCVMPTGAGKSNVAIQTVMRLRKKALELGRSMPKVLITVPLSPLVRQFQNSIVKFGDVDLCIKTGILAGSKSSKASQLADCDLIIGMLQTIEARKKLPWYPALVIWDEAHLGCFRQAYTIINQLVPKTKHLALTATPWRMDGQTFDDDWLWHQPVNTQELIDENYLVPYTVCALSRFSIKSKSQGDYTVKEAEQITTVASPEKVWKEWQKYRHLHTVGFVPSHITGNQYADYFRSQGQECYVITDETPEKERVQQFKAFRERKIVLFSVTVLATGFDEPVATCALMLRPTKSISLWIQMLGRILRIVQGEDTQWIEGSKEMAYILDFCGNSTTPGMYLPGEITDWKEVDVPKGRECEICGFVNQKGAKVCAECGHEFVVSVRRSPEEFLELDEEEMLSFLSGRISKLEDNRKLIEIKGAKRSEPREYYRYWLLKAFLGNYSPGMAYYKVIENCEGQKPSSDWATHACCGENPSFEDFLVYAFYLKSIQNLKSKTDAWFWKQLTNEFGVTIVKNWHEDLMKVFAKIYQKQLIKI
jgi:superfamily II DNA or RNA helicase